MEAKVWLIGFIAVALLFLNGCALQADMVDIQWDVDDLKAEKQVTQKKLGVIESYLNKTSSFSLQNQADLGIRVDEMGYEIQMLQGKLEENRHLLSELARQGDDQAYRLTELLRKMDLSEKQSGLKGMKHLKNEPPKPEEGKREITILPGKRITPREMETPGSARSGSSNDLSGGRVGGLTPTEAYNLAYNDYIRGNYDLAQIGFQNFLNQFPSSSLQASAHYWLGESYFNRKEYKKAVDIFQTLLQRYPRNDKVPSALLKEGYAYLELGDNRKGKGLLKKIIEQFPFSNEAKLAKGRLAQIQ